LYREFNNLKSSNAGLKTLVAVGGWNLDQTLFSKVSSTKGARKTFARSVVRFLQQHDFDGLDLDWEYPVTRQGTPEDHDNYPLLVEAIRDALTDSGRHYLLTMAVPVNPSKLYDGFNLGELSKYLDWFHLMSYDIHGSWDNVAGSNTDLEYIANTVENSVLNRGVEGDQLVFGMAAYGRSMQLVEPSCTTAGCPIDGAGFAGCSGELGFSPYFELKEEYVDKGNYESLLINERTGSMEMVVDGDVFVSLDVEDTFEMKREYYLSKCFRGQMWWAIDMIKHPPFRNSHPVASVNGQTSADINNHPPPPATGQALPPTPGVNNAPPPASPPNLSLNAAPGVNQDDSFCSGTTAAELVPIDDCSGFVFCQNGRMTGSVTYCSTGLIFDTNMGICNWPSETNLCGFEFCPNKMSGYVPFEDCTKFYHCKAGRIDGDIDVCPDGTLFDLGFGICNWASMVDCSTAPPTPGPTRRAPEPAAVLESPPAASGTIPWFETAATHRPTYGKVASPAAVANKPAASTPGAAATTPRPTYGTVAASPPSVVAFAASSPANAPTFQDNTARLRFAPSDDAYVQEKQPYQNYNDRFIVVDENLRYDGLLRFYVQGLEDRRINYVRLRLYVVNHSTFGGNFYKCRHTWHEDVVTWDTAPSILGSRPLAVVNHAVLKDDWVEIDLMDLVDGDGPVSLRITSDSSDNVMYSSKENPNGNAPELIVGVETLPVGGTTVDDEGAETEAPPTVTNTFKIGPTDDAYVSPASPDGNYGRSDRLEVDVASGGVRTAYLRFDLSRVHVNAVKDAMLRLYAVDSSMSGGTFVTVSDSNWNEDELTYDEAPVADGTVLGTLYNVREGEWYELDVTSAVTEPGRRALTIAVLGSHDDTVAYGSKDGPQSPEIVLTLEEVVPLSSRGGRVAELLPTDDATITLRGQDLNFGTEETLVTDVSPDGMRNFLLRFDASDVPRGEVESAVLRLYALNEEPAFGGTFVQTRSYQWDEHSATWRHSPPSDGKVLGSIMEIERGSWYDLDVTPAVIGGSPLSIRVSSPHSRSAVYASRQSVDHAPKLIVQYKPASPIPEDFNVYIPTDDASVLMDRPHENFGRDSQLKVDGHGGVYNSLLRFDLSPIEVGTVTEAILRLYAVDGSPSGGTFVTTTESEWSQHSVTWDTAPDADGTILATLGEVVPYRWYEVKFTEETTQSLGGEAFSIRVAPSHGLRCAYSSSEDRRGHLPQLWIKEDMFNGME